MQDIGFWLLNDIVLAAAALEAANGMTSHSKTCYFVKCFARRWARNAEFSNASGDFAVFTMGDDQLTISLLDHLLKI